MGKGDTVVWAVDVGVDGCWKRVGLTMWKEGGRLAGDKEWDKFCGKATDIVGRVDHVSSLSTEEYAHGIHL